MKTHYLKQIILLIFLLINQITATAQTETSRAYATGIYVFCGNEIPKGFSYLIEKHDNNAWKPVAELKAPRSADECRAALMRIPAAVLNAGKPTDAQVLFAWTRLQNSRSIDSLYAFRNDPRFQYIAGVAWFDEQVTKPGNYRYRINKMTAAGKTEIISEISVAFPPRSPNTLATPLRFKLNERSVQISYEVNDVQNTTGLKLFRSYYLRNNFTEIPAKLMFTSEKGKMVAQLTDENVTKGFTYSYVAIPYDGLGNTGKASDTLNIAYLTRQADLGLITKLDITPDPAKGGNLLEWDYIFNTRVNTVEIFRSKIYDGNYQRIASVNPSNKSYFDNFALEPAKAYFYYIVISDGKGNSLPCARTPAILEGRRPNLIPPQDLNVTRETNVVTLSFRRPGSDIRSYYVYRADGYVGAPEMLQRMLHSSDSLLSYRDTLPLSLSPAVYSYAVASVNTSYNISPLSERVSVAFSGGRLPVPDKLNAIQTDNKITVTWNDAASVNAGVAGYNIFRKTIFNDKVETEETLIANTTFVQNFYTDTLLLPGRYYVYRVQCTGEETSDTGGHSQPAGILYTGNPLLQPGNVMAIPSGDRIIIKWSMPLSDNIASALVYRSTTGSEPVLLTEAGANAEQYEDTTARKGTMYFYFIVLKYKNNLISKPTDAVSGKL